MPGRHSMSRGVTGRREYAGSKRSHQSSVLVWVPDGARVDVYVCGYPTITSTCGSRGVTSGPDRPMNTFTSLRIPKLAREIDPRLHREPDPGQQHAGRRGSRSHPGGARAVQVPVDRVAGPVDEGIAIARPLEPPREPPDPPRTPRCSGAPPRPRRMASIAASRARAHRPPYLRDLGRQAGSRQNRSRSGRRRRSSRLRPAQRSSRTRSPGRSTASLPGCGS